MEHLTEVQLHRILELAKPEHRLWIVLSYHHALRISEVLALRPEDISAGRITCCRGKDSLTTIEALVRSEDALLDEPSQLYIGGSDAFELLSFKGFDFSRQYAHRVFHQLAIKAGVHSDLAHPHVLKHTCGMHLIQAGCSLEVVQRALGHKRLSSTERYLKADDQSVSTAKQQVFGSISKAKGAGQ